MSRIIILSAPSGTGKSSVIAQLIDDPALQLSFSISATNRAPRGSEQDGVEYYFLSPEDFERYRAQDLFIESVEVYPGRFYGTLKSEWQRIANMGKNLMLDIDVEGALEVKRKYGEEVLAIFLMPPSLQELRKRLELRATDAPEVIEERLKRAAYEMSLASRFDCQIVNDNLDCCIQEVRTAIIHFLSKE